MMLGSAVVQTRAVPAVKGRVVPARGPREGLFHSVSLSTSCRPTLVDSDRL